MATTAAAATGYLLALYRAWPTLPRKATRAYVDAARAALATELASDEPATALAVFAATVEPLLGVTGALAAARAPLHASANAGAALSADERAQISALAAAPDPFAVALEAMFWQPPQMVATLDALRRAAADPRLPAEAVAAAAAHFAALDTALPAARAAYAATLALYTRTLDALQAIPALRRLAWRAFIDAKVISANQVITRLGGGQMPQPAPQPAPLSEREAVAVALYSDVDFPRSVKRSTTVWEPLTVRLVTTPGAPDAAAVTVPFIDPATPELVDVLLTAPGFEERLDLWQRTILVYADRPSQPAIFLLRSNLAGDKRLTVDFYHAGRQIGSAAFATSVQETTTTARATAVGEGVQIDALPLDPPPPADLELRVVRGVNENRLTFTLHSANPAVGFHWTPAGEVELARANPLELLEEKFSRLSLLAGQPAFDAEQTTRAAAFFTALGEELWDEVLPERFKTALWPEIRRLRDAGLIHSFLITSDEPWIPWEMVKPYTVDVVSEEESAEPFWAEQFALSRWLAGRGAVARTGVTAARLVAPDLDLEFVDVEKATYAEMGARGIATAPPLQSRAAVQALLLEGGVQLVHVAAHGSFDAANPGRARVTLQDGVLTPDDLSPSATKGLRAARPLLFLNACSVGRLGFGLTGLGGWADKLINTARVGAFIGTLWDVNDELAAAFAQHFYARLFAGDALGDAFHAARLHIRDQAPANPTWLAYTLYGDPNGVVRAAEQP